MRLIGYCRISTSSQSDNTSLADQRRKLEAYCLAYDHVLVDVFNEQESGKNASQRPIFNQAIEMVKTDADGIIATKLDRIARNTRDVLTLVEDVLVPNKKSLILLDLQVDTSKPIGKMILTVMAAVATLERDTIAERTQGGRKAKKELGGYAYGSPKFGEQSVESILVKDEDEQKVIEIIRKHYKSGKTFYGIAKFLNENNYLSKRGKLWTHQTVSNVYKRLYPKD